LPMSFGVSCRPVGGHITATLVAPTCAEACLKELVRARALQKARAELGVVPFQLKAQCQPEQQPRADRRTDTDFWQVCCVCTLPAGGEGGHLELLAFLDRSIPIAMRSNCALKKSNHSCAVRRGILRGMCKDGLSRSRPRGTTRAHRTEPVTPCREPRVPAPAMRLHGQHSPIISSNIDLMVS
jgi:hypothetical protein